MLHITNHSPSHKLAGFQSLNTSTLEAHKMKYKATLHNNTCAFDSVILSNITTIKEWAKGRGYSYFLKIESICDDIPSELVITYNVKNNKFYKVN